MKKYLLGALVLMLGVSFNVSALQANSGAKSVKVRIKTDAKGMTIEQRNVADRMLTDNKAGAIKHLYIISAYSGQAILYSTVKGKVTSSGKRLIPKHVNSQDGASVGWAHAGQKVRLAGKDHYTAEVIGDDGTYGSSVPYVYWWDVQGRYHQHYVSGGQIMHVSSQPLPVKSITINVEATTR